MWQLAFYQLFFLLYVCLVCTHVFYYTKAILMRREHRNNAPTTNAVGRHHIGALNNWRKTKICKKHQTFELWNDWIKKLDEDAHRIKNRDRLFLSKSSKVLSQYLTWCGRTLTFLGIKSLLKRVHSHAGCTKYWKDCRPTVALKLIDVIDKKQMHDSVITVKENASKEWNCIIRKFLTSFNVCFVFG